MWELRENPLQVYEHRKKLIKDEQENANAREKKGTLGKKTNSESGCNCKSPWMKLGQIQVKAFTLPF